MPRLAKQAQAQLADQMAADLITTAELAAELKVSEKTLESQRSRKVGLPYIKLSGGIVRYSRKAVREWLEANTVDHGGAA